jgi:3-oxoacyl-[acyl-carrier protein] reductase
MGLKKVAIISGGSRGLGSSLVSKFLNAGWIVATFSRSSTQLVRSLIEKYGEEKFLWRQTDITCAASIKQFLSEVIKTFGEVDVLINNAGVGADGLLTLSRTTVLESCIDINLKSTISMIQLCTKVMLRQGRGCIINISSVNAIRGHSGVAVYSATKAALDGLTRSLARELGEKNIRVNSVAPGYFESDMVSGLNDKQKQRIIRRTPLNRLAKVEDIVNVVYFMASPESSFITGQVIVVDGGITC